MNARGLRRYVEDQLRGRRPRSFQPDEFEAQQVRTAIELRAARLGADAPRQEFLTDLHRRLAAQMRGDPDTGRFSNGPNATRRQVIVGTSAAAAAAAVALPAGIAGDRLLRGNRTHDIATESEMRPTEGTWQVVAASAEVTDGAMHSFDLGSVAGFVRRVDGQPEAISGVCTHQGCKLWFDQPDNQLRCPCHSTSFSLTGQVLTHALPISPSPLPRLQVRERNGAIEVFAPKAPPTQPA